MASTWRFATPLPWIEAQYWISRSAPPRSSRGFQLTVTPHGSSSARDVVAAHLRPAPAYLHVAPAPAPIPAAVEEQPPASRALFDELDLGRQQQLPRRAVDRPQDRGWLRRWRPDRAEPADPGLQLGLSHCAGVGPQERRGIVVRRTPTRGDGGEDAVGDLAAAAGGAGRGRPGPIVPREGRPVPRADDPGSFAPGEKVLEVGQVVMHGLEARVDRVREVEHERAAYEVERGVGANSSARHESYLTGERRLTGHTLPA
jgi:hypothetical protein